MTRELGRPPRLTLTRIRRHLRFMLGEVLLPLLVGFSATVATVRPCDGRACALVEASTHARA